MKKIIFSLSFIIASNFIIAQLVIPMSKTNDLYKRYLLRHDIYSFKKLSTLNETQTEELNKKMHDLDSLEDKVFIYGFGASDAVTSGNITANGGFSFGAQPHIWDRLFLSVGIGGNVQKKEKQDSVNINSIFFPDNASSVVYGYYEISPLSILRLCKYTYKGKNPNIIDNFQDDILMYAEGALQNRNIEAKDSTIHNFGIYNLSVGLKYRWTHIKSEKNKFCFDIGVAYGYTEISNQTQKSFQTIVEPVVSQTRKVPTIYRGINCVASVQYNDLIIYARLFNPLSVNGSLTYQNNVYFSTGVKITGTFFSF